MPESNDRRAGIEAASPVLSAKQSLPHGTNKRPHSVDRQFRRITNWLVVVGTAGFSGHFFLFLGYHMWRWGEDGWVVEIIKNHYAATIGLPLAAIAALCLVIMLKFAAGPIEFEGLGFKFRGASGPIVLWVLCFLAMAGAIRLLW